MFKQVIINLFILTSTFCFSNDTIRNSMNKIELVLHNSTNSLSFTVAGHLYGAHSESIYPSSSIFNNIDKFKGSDFIVLLGDNYRFIDTLNISNFQNKFLNQFNIPIFNAIGNHDISSSKSSQDYEGYFRLFNKQTYFNFTSHNTLFIFLDTESHLEKGKSNGSIVEDQLLFLKNSLEENKHFKNIIIFTHKELNLWDNNYKTEIEPLLKTQIKKGKNINIISGDMGKYSPDLYYMTDSTSNINYIHTHITDSRKDNVLKFKIDNSGNIDIKVVSLENYPREKINHYKYYSKLNSKLITPTLAQKILNKFKNKNYLFGFLSGLILILLIWFLKNKLKSFSKPK